MRSPLPIPFEENRGQASADVAYLLRAGSLQVAFGAQGVSYTVLEADPWLRRRGTTPSPAIGGPRGPSGPLRAYTVYQELVGARPVWAPVGALPAPTRVNYLKGPAEHWLTDLPTFDQLARTDAWAGIDVLYERSGAASKSTYQVAPGRRSWPDPACLAWRQRQPRRGR